VAGRSRRNADRIFGSVLRKERLAAGLSQEALAHRAGCHPTFISLLEHGKNCPSLATLMALAHALEIRASDLVRATEDALR
jgi:transcriptional regulator with XRE-family HTH domain